MTTLARQKSIFSSSVSGQVRALALLAHHYPGGQHRCTCYRLRSSSTWYVITTRYWPRPGRRPLTARTTRSTTTSNLGRRRPRLTFVTQDARHITSCVQHSGKRDLEIRRLPTPLAALVPPHLMTAEFYQEIADSHDTFGNFAVKYHRQLQT